MTTAPDWLVVGKIVAAFGTKGEIRVLPQTDFPRRFDAGRQLYVERQETPIQIEGVRWHKGQAILKLKGVDDRDQAESLRGRFARVPGSDLAELGEDEYYLFQIVGLRVVTDEGVELGRVSEVLQTGANDVYVVPRGGRELLLPAIAEVIREVDLPADRLVVHLLPGLLPDEPVAEDLP